VKTYNELIPAEGELSASLLIECETPAQRGVWLPALLGLEKHIRLECGGQRAQARFDDRQVSTKLLSSIQCIKFPLSPRQVAAFPAAAKIVIDLQKYQAKQKLTPAQRRELATDLQETALPTIHPRSVGRDFPDQSPPVATGRRPRFQADVSPQVACREIRFKTKPASRRG
jgi:hypothetical protein